MDEEEAKRKKLYEDLVERELEGLAQLVRDLVDGPSFEKVEEKKKAET